MREEVMDVSEQGTQVTGQVNVVMSKELEAVQGLPDHMHGVARQLQSWLEETREKASSSVGSTMMIREGFSDLRDVFGQMRMAKEVAGSDDVVASALEVTEGLAWQGVKWESEDHATADIFNQMAAEQNLDNLVRQVWREGEVLSQAVVAAWWDTGTFSVRGQTEKGNKRKATKKVYYPRKFSILDSSRVLPVGSLHFGQERLAWVAGPMEVSTYEQYLAGQYRDDVMERFYKGFYTPTALERVELAGTNRGQGIAGINGVRNIEKLILLDGESVTRHTLTRADYERWAPVRLRSIFPLVDLKHQLMQADRVALVGAANYILLVKKGDKDQPGQQSEIDNLKQNFKLLARIPVIFSDHRLNIEIITPKQDFTLMHQKYSLLDNKILHRMLNAMPEGTRANSVAVTSGMGRWTSRTLESRRKMVARYLEETVARAVVNHPQNAGVFQDGPPSLSFFPANVMLDSDATLAQQILSLRATRDLSRESTLEYFGFDEAVEAVRMAFEEAHYDDVFKTQVPFSAPGAGGPPAEHPGAATPDGTPPHAQGPAGAQGGRPLGGGKPSQNPLKTQRTGNGTSSTKG